MNRLEMMSPEERKKLGILRDKETGKLMTPEQMERLNKLRARPKKPKKKFNKGGSVKLAKKYFKGGMV